MPVIDIALASYNGSCYLTAQIDSIYANDLRGSDASLGQVYVSDNMSNDDSLHLLQSLQQKYASLVPEQNFDMGVIQNFNHALRRTGADYVMLSDQDDVWFSNKIALSWAKMRELESQFGQHTPLLVFTDLEVTDAALNRISDSFFEFQKAAPELYLHPSRMVLYNIAPGCTMLLNRALLDLAMPVAADCAMHDWWFLLIAGMYGKIAYLDQPTMFYRQHANNQVGVRVTSFWEKLLSPRRKYLEAKKNLDQAIQHCKTVSQRFPDIPPTFQPSVQFMLDFPALSRYARVRGLYRKRIQSPTFWGAILLYGVAIFAPVVS